MRMGRYTHMEQNITIRKTYVNDETRPAVDVTVDDTELCVSVPIHNSPPAATVSLKCEKELSIKAVRIGMSGFAAVIALLEDPGHTVKVVLIGASCICNVTGH